MNQNLLLLTTAQASKALSISPRKLWALTASGQLAHVRIGRSVRYDLADLREFVAAQKQEPRQKASR